MELNKVLLIGNLTHDPESRHLAQSGKQVTTLRMASNRRWGSGDDQQETLYIDVDVWGRQAENCSQYLQKGSQILVEGRLKMDTFQTQSGENRTKYKIVADNVRFGSRTSSPEGGAPRSSGGGGRQQGGGGWGDSGGARETGPSYDEPAGGEGTEDDLPF